MPTLATPIAPIRKKEFRSDVEFGIVSVFAADLVFCFFFSFNLMQLPVKSRLIFKKLYIQGREAGQIFLRSWNA